MSRLDDHLRDDLAAIAERVTPSPDAWASIQQRIADRDPDQETEIIMLTENTTTMRRWPLLAAAAAVIALTIGAVVLANRDDGTEAPATPPSPTAVDVAPRTVELTGEVVAEFEFSEPDADGRGTYTGTETWTGSGVSMEARIATGTYEGRSPSDVGGQATSELEGTIDGIGAGGLTIEIEWQQLDGDIETSGQIAGGTGAFEGASGTVSITGNADDDEPGTWTMTLTLPADRFADEFAEGETADTPDEPTEAPAPREFTLTGTQDGTSVFGEPDADGRASMLGTQAWSGDVVGTAESVGFADPNDAGDGLEGRGWLVVDATIDGVGSGLLIIDDRWAASFDGTVSANGTILGGSGDLVGATGTYTASAPQGSDDAGTADDVEVGGPYTLELVLPPTGVSAGTQTTSLAGVSGGALVFDVPDDGSPATHFGEMTWTGDITGSGLSYGESVINEAGDGLEADSRQLVEATIDGVGAGVLIIDGTFSSKFTGSATSTGTIVAGTGDLAGASGTLEGGTRDGSNDAETEDDVEFGGPYLITLTLPVED